MASAHDIDRGVVFMTLYAGERARDLEDLLRRSFQEWGVLVVAHPEIGQIEVASDSKIAVRVLEQFIGFYCGEDGLLER